MVHHIRPLIILLIQLQTPILILSHSPSIVMLELVMYPLIHLTSLHIVRGPRRKWRRSTSGPKTRKSTPTFQPWGRRTILRPTTWVTTYRPRSAKIARFAADSSGSSADTVIATIENNSSFITNADVMQVYAYMSMGDYTHRQQPCQCVGRGPQQLEKPAAYPNKPWPKQRLCLQFGRQQRATAILRGPADNDTLDGHGAAESSAGMGWAKALASPACTRPRIRQGWHTESPEYKKQRTAGRADTAIHPRYPNPSQTGFTIAMPMQSGQNVKMELRDLPGRLIYI